MKVSLTGVTSVMLPRSVMTRTHAHLAATGMRGLEGMALWAGVQEGHVFDVREVIIPEQQGIRSDHGLAVMVPGPELQRINLYLYRSKLRLLAQIHSHPTHAYHSEMDDEYAIATALGAFSLVVPDFARDPFSIARCATYRLTPRPWWKSGSRPEWKSVAAAAAIFNIVEG
ncbi:Mov34/MPN/PAD-1 family protein [Bradyrhizobium sp. CIAT3101]|uniref:Mov34/MPN/PAD-1 family protein n=1 Tax=Bradyrhizobium sp. CIAT3101 TaxID=439387 RepID=UPI0024B18EE3|nr:Mov34/MPN/PAD-1 family protein [Bradyrhizobium sp. CIAT3101]WFU80767.1 Mov34/MPN/PAD-1 family protein [Bradyrhizobium sp. CIAT3101]